MPLCLNSVLKEAKKQVWWRGGASPGCSQALLQRCNGQKLLSVFGETASITPVNAGAVMGAGSQQRTEGACSVAHSARFSGPALAEV